MIYIIQLHRDEINFSIKFIFLKANANEIKSKFISTYPVIQILRLAV